MWAHYSQSIDDLWDHYSESIEELKQRRLEEFKKAASENESESEIHPPSKPFTYIELLEGRVS